MSQTIEALPTYDESSAMSLAATIDLRAAIEQLSPETGLRFALPLVLWNAATLAIEGHCLHRVTAACGRRHRPQLPPAPTHGLVACYVWMVGVLFWAFGVEISPIALALKVAVLLLISTLPIAAAGIGTAQVGPER